MKKSVIFLFIILVQVSCKKSHGETEPLSPTPKRFIADVPLQRNINKGDLHYYSAAVNPGQKYSISITGLADKKIALSQATNKTFDVLNISFTREASPKELFITAADTVLFVVTDGTSVLAPVAPYTLLLMPVNPVSNPINEGSIDLQIPITAGTPFTGQVGTRGTSYYVAENLVAGTSYTVSLTGLTEDADLHLYTDASYSLELDCTLNSPGDVTTAAEECILTTSGELYIAVRCGELNRVGTGYTILINKN